MAFEVVTVRGGAATILSCRGRLVAEHGAAALRCAARRELSAGRLLALDLACVTQLDARGVGILAEACDVARMRGARILLAGANARIRRLLRLTHLDTIIQELAADDVSCHAAEIEPIDSAWAAVSALVLPTASAKSSER
jgi:anti-anti-sigma factor